MINATITLASPQKGMRPVQHADWLQLRQLAEHMFNILRSHTGLLILHMPAPAELYVPFANHNPGLAIGHHHGHYWTVDGALTIHTPPILNFRHMPTEVNQVTLRLYGNGDEEHFQQFHIQHHDAGPQQAYTQKAEFAYANINYGDLLRRLGIV